MASQYPKRFYGLHMAEGCAEYREPDKEPYKIFVGEKTIFNMNKSFEGKPVFVGHADEVGPEITPDGHVIRSFFNKVDGKTWCEFIVTSDKGMDAINAGWKLSNAYIIKQSAQGGRWHGIDFDKEVIEAEYDHLAIVDDPRYAESIIMTPEQFKEYCKNKELELESVQNSNNNKPKKGKSMLNFFKKEKLENASDFDGVSVMLPKSKKEIEIARLINEADEEAMNEDQPQYAVAHEIVKINEDEEMTVEELINKYKNMCEEIENMKKNEEKEEEKKEENEEEEKEKEKEENEDEEEKKEENEDEEEKKENSNYKKLMNAGSFSSEILETSIDQVERGRIKYGSK